MSGVARDVERALREAIAFAKDGPTRARVHIPPEIDVKAIRKSLRMTREEFCDAFGFSVEAVRDWERGRRCPDRSARAFLRVIAKEPIAVRRALAS